MNLIKKVLHLIKICYNICIRIKKSEKKKLEKNRKKLTIYNYESLHIIGKGSFGEVHVCRNKETKEIVAIKKIKKELLIKKNQIKHIRDEIYH